MADRTLRWGNRLALALLLGGAAFSGWFVACGGLLIEPVAMDVLGSCGPGCTRVRCRFQNQAPIPARGDVVIDVWTPGGAGVREVRSLRLGVRAVEEVRVEAPIERAPDTMVRCMPWYAGAAYVPDPG